MKEMIKISVILSFLLCWSFVSPNPHNEKSNDKSVGANHINDGSDLNLVKEEDSDEASSGKDWGGNFFNFLNIFNHKDPDNIDELHETDNKSFLDKLIDQGSNFLKTIIPKNKPSDNSLFGNVIEWVQKNVVDKLLPNKDNNAVSEIKESESIDEKTEKHSNRAKRDLKASSSGLLWSNKGGISEHLLKLNDGSKVLKSEKATVAEALNGRAAIRKILAQAKAKAAKAAIQNNLYDDDDDFNKWLLSKSSFDTSIFKHPVQSADNTEIIDNDQNNHSETDNTDNNTFSMSHNVSKSMNHDHHLETKHTLLNSAAINVAGTNNSSTKLLHKSEHQEHLSSKIQSASEEKHGRDTNEMLHKLTISRHTHGLSPHEDEEDTGLGHAPSHVHAPHTHPRATKDQETGNNIPKWEYAEWTPTDSNTYASDTSAELYEYETSDEEEEYGRDFIFKTSIESGDSNEKIYFRQQEGDQFSEEINSHEEDEDEADSLFQYGSSIDSHREENIRNGNKQNLNEIQDSVMHSTTSTETKEGIENQQSGNMLDAKVSTGTPTQKSVNVDIEHYHSRDQNVAVNGATSFLLNFSDKKESKRTNNVLASPSLHDGSAIVETKTNNNYSRLGRMHSVIDNDVTLTGIETDFGGIKNYPLVDSSLSHTRSKSHLGNQKEHSINEYEHSTTNTVASETKHLMDSKTLTESQNKDHNLKANKKISANVASSTKIVPSIIDEYHHERTPDEQISDEEDPDKEGQGNYIETRKKYMDLKKELMDNAQDKSIEVIDIADSSAEVLIPEFPNYKHGKAYHTNYYDFDGDDISDNENNKSDENLKRIKIDYDNLEEEKMTDNIKASKESQITAFNEQNHHKDNNRYNHHSVYNRHKHHNQENHRILNQETSSIKSSTASNATKFDTWNKYIYYIEERERKKNKSNALSESSASVIEEGKKKSNAKYTKISLNEKEKKYISDENKHRYLETYKNLSNPTMHSIEINKITTNNEEKIKSENNIKNKSKVVASENLISDSSTSDTTSYTKHRNKNISKNNNYYSQTSWDLMSLKNSRADAQTVTEDVYDSYGENKNVNINTKQIVKAAHSNESKSNIQSISSKTSESDNTKEIVDVKQASDEKILSSDRASGYQDYNEKISDSSKLIAKSQTDTVRHSNEKLKNNHKINANAETLTKIASSSDTMDKQNAIAFSKSSAKSQIESWDYCNNKKHSTNAKISADATVSDVKDNQRSILENTSTFSKLPMKSEIKSEKYSNNLKNSAISSAKLRAANQLSIGSKIKTKQESNNYNSIQRNANVKTSATSDNVENELFSSSRKSQLKNHSINNKNNQINSISKESAESVLSNIEDKSQSHLQKLLSSLSVVSSEKSQEEYEHNNLQKNEINVPTAAASIQSIAFDNSDNEKSFDLSNSLSSKWLEEKHMNNKHYSNNIKLDRKDNTDATTEIRETSSGIVGNSHQQKSLSSLSSSSSSVKSQILNKNTNSIITSNNMFDVDEYNLLHASSTSQTASKSNLNVAQNNDLQTANTATLSIAALNEEKYKRENNELKSKSLTNLTKKNIEIFANNKNIEKNESIKSKLESNNIIETSSSSNSNAKSWTHNESDLNQLKEGKIIINNLIGSKISNNIEKNHKNKLLTISSLFDSHSKSKEEKKNHINIMENNQKLMDTELSESLFSTKNKQLQNDLVKETTLSKISKEVQRKRNNFNMSREKLENINANKMQANKIINKTTFNSANHVYYDNLLKDIVSNNEIRTSDKIKDKNEINAEKFDSSVDNSANEINSEQIKFIKENNVYKLSKDLSTLNGFNSKNRNNILTSTSDELYAEMSQRDQHKSDILSNINRITNTNVRDKYRHGLISSTDTKIQSMMDHKSNILRNKEMLNSETRNNINKWNTKSQTKIFKQRSSSNAESIVNNVNKDAYDPMQEKFTFDLKNIVKADKQFGYENQKANVINSGEASTEISNSRRFIEHLKNKRKMQSRQNKLNHHKITSNIVLSEGSNSSEMKNAHQDLLKDVTASNSRTKVQHEQISNVVEESLKLNENAATSAQTMSSEKVENKSQGKLVRDSTKSNSYVKSQIEDKNESSALEEGQIISSTEILANSAISNNIKNIRQNKLNKNLLSDLKLYATRNKNRKKILKNSLANTADAIASAKETSFNIMKNKYQSDTEIASNKASISNLNTKEQIIKRGYNSNLQTESVETSSSDMMEHEENKNSFNNIESLTAATNAVTSAISSNIIKTNIQDSSKISSSNLYTASQMNNIHLRNVGQDNQKEPFTVIQALPISLETSINNQDKQKEILHIQDSNNQRIKKNKNNNHILRKVYDDENTAVSKQATSFSNIINTQQNNLLKATSLINSFADTQRIEKDESSIHKNQHLITTDSKVLSDSAISDCIDSNKNDFEKLTGISSSNSYANSNVQNKNYVDILKKKHSGKIFNADRSGEAIISSEFKDTKQNKLLQMASSSNTYTETEMENDNNSIKRTLDAALSTKIKTVPSNYIKYTDSHDLFSLLANDPSKKLIENKNIFQKNAIKESLSEISSDLSSKTQIKSAHDSRILKDDYKNSAMVHNHYRNQQEDLHKTQSLLSNVRDSQHNVKSISLENSYVAAANDNIKNEKAETNGEVIFNLSTLGKIKMNNKIREEHLNNWPITMSDTAILAEECATNNNKFNNLKTTEIGTVYSRTAAETSAANNIETEHNIHIKDRSKLENSWNAETKIQNTISDASAQMIALKRMKNNDVRKSTLDNELATLSSNEAHTETQIINKEKYNVKDISKSSIDNKKTQSLIGSAMSSGSASTSSNMNIDLGTKYDQINNKMSTTSFITPVSRNTEEREKYLSSIQTSSHLSNQINGCNKDVETRKFISQATSLYKVLDKQQDSEILLMKRNFKGPVQIASFKNSVPPLIAYRLIPREVYERIRNILKSKQIFCTDCPLSNS